MLKTTRSYFSRGRATPQEQRAFISAYKRDILTEFAKYSTNEQREEFVEEMVSMFQDRDAKRYLYDLYRRFQEDLYRNTFIANLLHENLPMSIVDLAREYGTDSEWNNQRIIDIINTFEKEHPNVPAKIMYRSHDDATKIVTLTANKNKLIKKILSDIDEHSGLVLFALVQKYRFAVGKGDIDGALVGSISDVLENAPELVTINSKAFLDAPLDELLNEAIDDLRKHGSVNISLFGR